MPSYIAWFNPLWDKHFCGRDYHYLVAQDGRQSFQRDLHHVWCVQSTSFAGAAQTPSSEKHASQVAMGTTQLPPRGRGSTGSDVHSLMVHKHLPVTWHFIFKCLTLRCNWLGTELISRTFISTDILIYSPSYMKRKFTEPAFGIKKSQNPLKCSNHDSFIYYEGHITVKKDHGMPPDGLARKRTKPPRREESCKWCVISSYIKIVNRKLCL